MLVVIRTKLVGRHECGTGGLPERAETLVTPWNRTVGGTVAWLPVPGKDDQDQSRIDPDSDRAQSDVGESKVRQPEPVDHLDVVCLGNALVDVLSTTTDEELGALDLNKGSMALVDLATAGQIYWKMRNTVEVSGGSAANTAAGVAALGGRAGYIGNVADDELGKVFVHDMTVLGVELGAGLSEKRASRLPGQIQPAGSDGRPDAATNRPRDRPVAGARHTRRRADDGDASRGCVGPFARGTRRGHGRTCRDRVRRGLPVGQESAKEAVRRAMSIAHSHDGLVALSASDPFCVERHRQELLALLHGDVDLLFCNEDEALLLFGAGDLSRAISAIEETGLLAAVTRGADGCVVVMADGPVEVPAEPVERVVDTTGAGDLFAAGFLYGLTHGLEPVSCARLGGACAAEVISHLGARPQSDISGLVTSSISRIAVTPATVCMSGSGRRGLVAAARHRLCASRRCVGSAFVDLLCNPASLGLGATGIELDVHATSDRQLVVCHDATVDRTTDSSGWIADQTLAELRTLGQFLLVRPRCGCDAGPPGRRVSVQGPCTGRP